MKPIIKIVKISLCVNILFAFYSGYCQSGSRSLNETLSDALLIHDSLFVPNKKETFELPLYDSVIKVKHFDFSKCEITDSSAFILNRFLTNIRFGLPISNKNFISYTNLYYSNCKIDMIEIINTVEDIISIKFKTHYYKGNTYYITNHANGVFISFPPYLFYLNIIWLGDLSNTNRNRFRITYIMLLDNSLYPLAKLNLDGTKVAFVTEYIYSIDMKILKERMWLYDKNCNIDINNYNSLNDLYLEIMRRNCAYPISALLPDVRYPFIPLWYQSDYRYKW